MEWWVWGNLLPNRFQGEGAAEKKGGFEGGGVAAGRRVVAILPEGTRGCVNGPNFLGAVLEVEGDFTVQLLGGVRFGDDFDGQHRGATPVAIYSSG